MDRIKLLHVRAVLHAHGDEWQQAEKDFRDALLLADRQPDGNPSLLRTLLDGYSYVLPKNHRRQFAKFVEERAAALQRDRTTAAIVDLSALLLRKGAKY
jgi:hypothetical protein